MRPSFWNASRIPSPTSVGVMPREVFQGALAANASAIVLAHNHPTGNPTPSDEDIVTTKKLVQAGGMIGVPILDHVIVGLGGELASIRDIHPGIFER